MSNMVTQMKLVDHDENPKSKTKNHLEPGNAGDQENSSGRSSPLLVPNYKEELERVKLQTEREQMKRIRKREQLQLERERLLVLQGKMELRPEHRNDPVLKLQFQFQKLEKKAKAVQAKKLRRKKSSTSKVSAKSAKIKMKWTSAKDKLKLKNFVMDDEDTCDDDTEGPETVMANLIYDEQSDELTESSNSASRLLDGQGQETRENTPGASGNSTTAEILHPNPVFQAFDGATCVDDLYRIAEIYVNPATYYDFD